MKTLVALALIMLFTSTADGHAQTSADSQAIRQVALDYIEGWYQGDSTRMAQALHPNLAKRVVEHRRGRVTVRETTADQLIHAASRGEGSSTPADQRRKDVSILDIYEGAASVKVVATDWVDYLHVGKVEDRWVIINVLWEWSAEAKAKMGMTRP